MIPDDARPLHLLNQHCVFIDLAVELLSVDGGDVDGLAGVGKFGARGGGVVGGGAFQHAEIKTDTVQILPPGLSS